MHTRTKFGISTWFGYYGAYRSANACINYYGKDSQKKKCEGKNLNFYIGPEALFVNGDASEEKQMTGETPE